MPCIPIENFIQTQAYMSNGILKMSMPTGIITERIHNEEKWVFHETKGNIQLLTNERCKLEDDNGYIFLLRNDKTYSIYSPDMKILISSGTSESWLIDDFRGIYEFYGFTWYNGLYNCLFMSKLFPNVLLKTYQPTGKGIAAYYSKEKLEARNKDPLDAYNYVVKYGDLLEDGMYKLVSLDKVKNVTNDLKLWRYGDEIISINKL